MSRRPRRNHSPALEPKVALERLLENATSVGKPFHFEASDGVHTLRGALELPDGSIVISKDSRGDLRSLLASERDLMTNFKTVRRDLQQQLAAEKRGRADDRAEADAIAELFAKVTAMSPDERFEWAEEFAAEVPKLRLEIEKQKLERERAELREERNPTPTAEEATEARQAVLQSELDETYKRVMAHPAVRALNPNDVNAVFRKHAARAEQLVSKEADGSEVFDDAEVLEDLEILVQAAAQVRPAPIDSMPRQPGESPFPPGCGGVYDPPPRFGGPLT